MLAELLTSRSREVAVPPSALMAVAACRPLASSLAATMTWKRRRASCRAVSKPMPRLAPVTSTIRRVLSGLMIILPTERARALCRPAPSSTVYPGACSCPCRRGEPQVHRGNGIPPDRARELYLMRDGRSAWGYHDNGEPPLADRNRRRPIDEPANAPRRRAADHPGPDGGRAGQRPGGRRVERRRPGLAPVRHARPRRHAQGAGGDPGADRPGPYNVNFFCHTPPAPDAEREAAWRATLAPYYEELGLDADSGPRGRRPRAVQRRGGRRARGVPARRGELPLRPAVGRAAGAGAGLGREGALLGDDRRGGAAGSRRAGSMRSSRRASRRAGTAACSCRTT